MRQEFLDSLAGMSLEKAERRVKSRGHTVGALDEGEIASLKAYPNMILLWGKDGKVVKATAGDPLEVDDR